MAGILQLRRGLKSTYISEGTNLAEAFFVTTAETGSISENTLIIGVSGSVGDDIITLAKLSLANKDNTYADYNSGSFWITGDYTGSNALIHRHLIVSGNTYMEGDLHLEGHLFLGSGSDDDVVRVQSEFSGSIIPDNDKLGTLTATATTAYYDLGADAKRYRNIYLQKDATGNGFLSGSHIDLTGNIKVDGEGRFGTLRVDDLTDNRILLAGVGGEVEDDANLTYDGQDFRLSNSDYYQIGTGASFQFDGSGMDITGSISNYQLRVDNGVVFTNAVGTLDNQSQFTWDGGLLDIDGGISASQNLSVGGEATLASAIVKDLTENRILIAGPVGEIEDDQYFRYTGNDFIIGASEQFKVTTLSGNTFISGAVQMFSTLNVDDQSTLASLNVEDLTDNRVVIVGPSGEIEDDGNFTFNGTELNIGTGNFTVQQGSGNTQILGTLDVDSQSTLASLNVQDLTSGRVVLAGTSGEIEDSGNLTFDGSTLTVTGDTVVTGNLTIQGTQTQLNTSILNVEDKNILIASGAVNSAAADGGGITIDGANATLTYQSANDWFTFNKDTQVQGDLYVTNEISSSTVNGIGNVELYSASVDSRLDYLEGPFSTSVDSRLDTIEGPMSTSLDLRLIEIFSTGSDHETRLDTIEGSFSTSLDSRLDLLESFSESIESHLPSGIISGSAISTDGTDLVAIGTSVGNVQDLGSGNQLSLYGQVGVASGILTFDEGGTIQSYDYTAGNYRYVDTNSGVGIVLKPDSDATKAWIVDTDGDLVSNGGAWSSGSVYANNLIASSSVTASNLLVDNDIIANNFIGNIQATNGVVSGSSQITDGSGIVSSSTATGIEIMTSASYAAITPVSGTLYIIQG